jgi:tRNA threonylcarbamoyladenosine biosynthesis protein TsaE
VAELFLPDETATLALGRAMAKSLPENWDSPTVLLRAALGSGKTTLARGFVSALSGSEDAEVASPSFNLVNVYPTDPSVVHIDLYRLGEGFLDAGLEELLDAGHGYSRRAVLVEWAEYLPDFLRPPSFIDLELAEEGPGRTARFTAHGSEASQWLERTLSTYLQSGKS